MKAQLLDNEDFDYLFKQVLEEKGRWGGPIIISTFDLVRKLWQKYRVAYKKQANIVRAKMREWWNSYEWKQEPRPHKMICGVAVHLASPMSYDYCALEPTIHGGMRSLITVYQNQNEFQVEST